MKILCETKVLNRQTQSTQNAPGKSTLAVGFRSSAKDANGTKELEIIHFKGANSAGCRYKVRNNIDKIFTKFVQDGKATISFRQPPVDLMIKCDAVNLKSFLKTLKLGVEGNASANLRLNIAGATAIPQKSQPQQKLTVLRRGDYPTKGFPKSLKQLVMSNIQLCKISFEICSLTNLTVLNISHNVIEKLPPELGRLKLSELLVNSNKLGEFNSWQWLKGKNLQNSLRHLDMSANGLSFFPTNLIKLEQLVTLKLNDNKIQHIPFGVRRMRNLRYIHLCKNKLMSLPSSLEQMRLDELDVWDNEFNCATESKLSSVLTCTTGAPPLWLLAARTVSEKKLPYSAATLPWLLVDILSEAPKCDCGKLCFGNLMVGRSSKVTFQNVKNLTHCYNRVIYADIVLCGPKCAGRKQILK